MRGADVDVVTSEYHCTVCGAAFIPRSVRHRVTCGEARCRRRAAYLSERSDAAYVARNRSRCAAWYEANKAQHRARVAERSRSPDCGAAGRWFVTPHAVEQFSARAAGWERASTYEHTLATIIDESRRAHIVKILQSGAELWRGPKPRRLRYIVRPGADGLPALVTVLSTYDRVQDAAPE